MPLNDLLKKLEHGGYDKTDYDQVVAIINCPLSNEVAHSNYKLINDAKYNYYFKQLAQNWPTKLYKSAAIGFFPGTALGLTVLAMPTASFGLRWASSLAFGGGFGIAFTMIAFAIEKIGESIKIRNEPTYKMFDELDNVAQSFLPNSSAHPRESRRPESPKMTYYGTLAPRINTSINCT